MNGWVNDTGEVFIIYTRESLASEVQISYRKVIECMKQLSAVELIWERRCGRGDANQIYLAKVELTDNDAYTYESVPFVSRDNEAAASRTAEITCLNIQDKQDMRKSHFKNRENRTSRTADKAHQDLRKPHTKKKDIKKTDKKKTNKSQSVRYDEDELCSIIEQCELELFPDDAAKVFENIIERLFYTDGFESGNCLLPNSIVRSRLKRLNYEILQNAQVKLCGNLNNEITNSTAYITAVVFNCITEMDGDLMVDPFLNRLRGIPPPLLKEGIKY